MNSKTKKEVQIINPTKGVYSDRLKRVAAYCRVSTDSADQINSFIAQVKYYNDFIEQSGDMTLVDIYADEGITGTCVNKRDEFQRMMKDSKAGKIDRIYVKSVSRFARNSLECIESIRLLKSYGTTVLFENDGIDTSTMNSEMILYIKSAFAQSEALAGSMRVSTAIRMKMANGEFSITAVPYGYTVENNTLVPVPELKPVIERIFRDYLSGKGFGKIAEELNEEKCTDRIWSASAIKYILHNEKYTGDSLLQKTYTPQILPLKKRRNYGQVDKYYVTDTHEALIDKELFNAVKVKLDRNKIERKYAPANEKFNFTQILRCGDCGCAFKRKIQSGEIYWVCSSNGIAGRRCKTRNIKENDLKKSFVRLFNRLKLYENEIVDSALNQLVSLKAKISSQSTAISDIDVEIAAICEKNCMLAKLKARNIIDDISYMEQTSALQKRLTELRQRRIKLLNEDEDEKSIERFRELKDEIDTFEGYMLVFDKEVFEAIVQNIFVSDDDYVTYELKCGLKLRERIQMSSRWILFGYKMEYCKYIIVPNEAETVRRIFSSYIDDMTLKAIADELTAEQIQYKEGRTTWNKNMIARIIENAHYAGDDMYPQIVSRDIFESALERKNTLGGKREKDTTEIKYLKSILFCSTCGGRIRRISKYTATHERWLCENNCKSNRYFDDSTLFCEIQSTVNAAISNPTLLDTNSVKSTYETNIETIRKEKEIRYMLDQPNIQFNTIKKAILDCIQSKFDCCAFDNSVYTEPLKEYMKTQKPTERLNIELLAFIAERIYINSDGTITIHFINGREICSTERNGAENAGSKNSN